MSIRLYSGIMGSGKTYRVVYELKFGDLLEKYFVFHNLEGLKIENKYLREYGKNSDFNPPDLFTYQFQDKLSKQIREEYGRNILWIIEECDKIGFDRSRSEIKEWLSMHRHLGQEIYLISQSKWNIAKEYVNLLEVEIQGKRGFVFDQFIYSWFSGGEKVATDRLPKKKEVYETYKSFHIPELKKKRSNIWKWAFAFGVIAACSIIYFFFFGLPNKFTDIGKKVNHTEKSFNTAINNQDQSSSPHVNKSTQTDSEHHIFYYGGSVGDRYYFMTDQHGNLFRMNYFFNRFTAQQNTDNRSLTIINDDKIIEMKPAYFKTTDTLARRGSGRETRPEQAEPQAETWREIWINIY